MDVGRNRGGGAGGIFDFQKPNTHKCCASRKTGHVTDLGKASRHSADRASAGK
jgi:hypothetical protein